VAILKVGRIGHPVVRSAAQPVPEAAIRSKDVQRLIDDMIETMHEYDGVGLAAPQIHVGLRLAVLEVPAGDERSEDGVPLLVLINPVLKPLSEEKVVGWEGCLSVPDLRGQVPRLRSLRLEAFDRQAKRYALEAHNFFARVIQHECDHLDGRVYLDRMPDMRSLSFLREFQRFTRGEDDGESDE
jgi:peptide deformylase